MEINKANCIYPIPTLKPSQPSTGRKYDKGKNRYDLISGIALDQLAEVYTMGAQKYDDHNWRAGLKWSRVFGAIMRHLWAFWRGETLDKESELSHLAHAAWGCFTLLEYSTTHKELDDRYDSPRGPYSLLQSSTSQMSQTNLVGLRAYNREVPGTEPTIQEPSKRDKVRCATSFGSIGGIPPSKCDK